MKLTLRLKGGQGSGFFGHSGRPGYIGGSMAADKGGPTRGGTRLPGRYDNDSGMKAPAKRRPGLPRTDMETIVEIAEDGDIPFEKGPNNTFTKRLGNKTVTVKFGTKTTGMGRKRTKVGETASIFVDDPDLPEGVVHETIRFDTFPFTPAGTGLDRDKVFSTATRYLQHFAAGKSWKDWKDEPSSDEGSGAINTGGSSFDASKKRAIRETRAKFNRLATTVNEWSSRDIIMNIANDALGESYMSLGGKEGMATARKLAKRLAALDDKSLLDLYEKYTGSLL